MRWVAALLLVATSAAAGEAPVVVDPQRTPGAAPSLCEFSPNKSRSFPATVLRVFDGDAVELSVSLGFGTFLRTKVGLIGIRSQSKWCRRGLGVEQCQAQKKEAADASAFTKDWTAAAKGLEFRLSTTGRSGRPLGYLCDQGKCLNYELLSRQLGSYHCSGAS